MRREDEGIGRELVGFFPPRSREKGERRGKIDAFDVPDAMVIALGFFSPPLSCVVIPM